MYETLYVQFISGLKKYIAIEEMLKMYMKFTPLICVQGQITLTFSILIDDLSHTSNLIFFYVSCYANHAFSFISNVIEKTIKVNFSFLVKNRDFPFFLP